MSPPEKRRQAKSPSAFRGGLSPSDHIQVAILGEQMGEVKNDIAEIKDAVRELTKKVAEINDLGTRWKGIFFLFLTVSSIISALLTAGRTIISYLPHS